jgi:hypothetical protein
MSTSIATTSPTQADSAGKPEGGGKGLYIPSLDGLRAVSIVIVFLSHVGLGRVVPGLFGVTVFFFLSGYLITTLLRLEWERQGRIDLKQFWMRGWEYEFGSGCHPFCIMFWNGFKCLVTGGPEWSAGWHWKTGQFSQVRRLAPRGRVLVRWYSTPA